jgi:hypothetical protein
MLRAAATDLGRRALGALMISGEGLPSKEGRPRLHKRWPALAYRGPPRAIADPRDVRAGVAISRNLRRKPRFSSPAG